MSGALRVVACCEEPSGLSGPTAITPALSWLKAIRYERDRLLTERRHVGARPTAEASSQGEDRFHKKVLWFALQLSLRYGPPRSGRNEWSGVP